MQAARELKSKRGTPPSFDETKRMMSEHEAAIDATVAKLMAVKERVQWKGEETTSDCTEMLNTLLEAARSEKSILTTRVEALTDQVRRRKSC